MLRIIDNKRVEITESEFQLYDEICKSFSKDNFDGKFLFKNLFETDGEGIITFLRAPTTTFSMEIVIFLQNLMVRQHLTRIYKEHDLALDELKKTNLEVKDLIEKLSST